MKKISIKAPNRNSKTYFMGRKCQFCGEPIEDQARKTKIHCTPWIDEYGVRHDCKREKHQQKHQPEEEVLLDFGARQRKMTRQIENLIQSHGIEVTTDMLTAFDIKLSNNVSYEYNRKSATFKFIGYSIVYQIQTNTHKIYKNGK